MLAHFLASTEHQCKNFECRIYSQLTYLNFVGKIFAFFSFTTEIISKYLNIFTRRDLIKILLPTI